MKSPEKADTQDGSESTQSHFSVMQTNRSILDTQASVCHFFNLWIKFLRNA